MENRNKLNGEELIQLIQVNMSAYDFAYAEDGEYEFNEEKGLEIFGKSIEVENFGGNEGDGQKRFVVRHFLEHDIYVRLDGHYDSYRGDGDYFDSERYRIVRPTEVTKIEYI